MNFVDINGGRKDQRALAALTVAVAADALGLGRTRTLQIDLKITRGLFKKTGAEAFYLMGDTNKEHEIEVDAELGLRDFITAICHEMVHLKQAYRKEMIQKNNGRTYWKGKDCTDVDYLNQPWEKEAYKLQDEIALKVWEVL